MYSKCLIDVVDLFINSLLHLMLIVKWKVKFHYVLTIDKHSITHVSPLVTLLHPASAGLGRTNLIWRVRFSWIPLATDLLHTALLYRWNVFSVGLQPEHRTPFLPENTKIDYEVTAKGWIYQYITILLTEKYSTLNNEYTQIFFTCYNHPNILMNLLSWYISYPWKNYILSLTNF